MPNFTIGAYNIRWMNRMFTGNHVTEDNEDRANAISAVINRLNPDILAISEAANADEEHQSFIDTFLNGGYQVVSGASRGGQNLVFYIRDPFQLVEIDEVGNFYDPWNVDIDEDKVTEHIRWDRKPLEAVFRIGQGANAQRIRVINVHAKSKGIFDVVDLSRFQEISLGNRKKLIAQATKLRERLDELLAEATPVPTVVLGDMNDGPGLDAYERKLGRSFVETTMGSVFNPESIFRNALQHIDDELRWTADFPDPIVNNPRDFNHRVWIDHILVSPDLADPQGQLRLVAGSGEIDENDDIAELASDHFAVSCVLTNDPP